MDKVNLSNAVRSNLLTMKSTADMMATTQTRLATGNKVNSALDNPTNFFTASALNSRGSDLTRLLDSVGNAVQTIEAADNGIDAITTLVESAQATARQALQSAKAGMSDPETQGDDISTGTGHGTNATAMALVDDASSFVLNTGSGGATTTTINVAAGASLDDVAAAINAETGTTNVVATVVESGGDYSITLENTDGTNGVTVDTFTGDGAALGLDTAIAAGATDTGATVNTDPVGTSTSVVNSMTASDMEFTVDGVVSTVTLDGTESMAEIAEKISSVDGVEANVVAGTGTGEFKIEVKGNEDTEDFAITGANAVTLGIDGVLDTPAVDETSTTRKNLENEFNALLKQIDQLTSDASYNGNNFLSGDDLKVIFNETGTSSLTIKGVDTSSSGLNLVKEVDGNFQDNTKIETTLDSLEDAITTLRSNASTFGSNLSTVQARQDFTENMVNTLESGASNLTLADVNTEGANMLALQTRQSLATTALSMASQADQNVLQLF